MSGSFRVTLMGLVGLTFLGGPWASTRALAAEGGAAPPPPPVITGTPASADDPSARKKKKTGKRPVSEKKAKKKAEKRAKKKVQGSKKGPKGTKGGGPSPAPRIAPPDPATLPLGPAQPGPAGKKAKGVGPTASSAPKAPPKKGKGRKKKRFIKGELLLVGDSDVLGARSRAGAWLGYRAIGLTHYATIYPAVDIRYGRLRLGLYVPLNLEIFNGEEGLGNFDMKKGTYDTLGFNNAGSIRSEDWDHWRDFFQVIRYITWNRKESNLYIAFSQSRAASIGHGTIMKRYMPQIDLDTKRVGAQLDAYHDRFGGFEFYANDITRWTMLGFLAFVKPLAPFYTHYRPRSFSIGFTFVTDRTAPVTLARNANDPRKFALDESQDLTLPKAAGETAAVSIWGIDAEFKVYKDRSSDLKVYVDYSSMVDGGFGTAAGILGRFNTGSVRTHVFRARAEMRYFSGNYQPSYFDSFYEVDRWQFLTGKNEYVGYGDPNSYIQTKYKWVTSRPEDGQFGFFLEFGYSLIDRVAVGVALEGLVPGELYNLLVHFSIPWSDILRLSASFQKRHFQEWGSIFNFDQDNTWLRAMVRLKILPILYVNFQVGHLWRLKRDQYADGPDKGQPHADYGLFQQGFDWRVWFDLAYEFRLGKKKKRAGGRR